MKRITLVKRLEYKHGVSLNPHVPYPANLDEERNLWLVHLGDNAPFLPVLQKFVEKVIDTEPVLV